MLIKSCLSWLLLHTCDHSNTDTDHQHHHLGRATSLRAEALDDQKHTVQTSDELGVDQIEHRIDLESPTAIPEVLPSHGKLQIRVGHNDLGDELMHASR